MPGRRQKQRSVDGGSDGECWDSDDGNVEGYVYMAENNNSHPHLLSQDDETMPEVSAAEVRVMCS